MPPWQYTTFLDFLDHWQTLLAGIIALVAAIIAVMPKTVRLRHSLRPGRDAERVLNRGGERRLGEGERLFPLAAPSPAARSPDMAGGLTLEQLIMASVARRGG